MTRAVNDNWSKVRETIDWFQSVMLGKMAANTHKGDWNSMTPDVVYKRLMEEWREFDKASRKADKIQELADMANMCMILADNIRGQEDKA